MSERMKDQSLRIIETLIYLLSILIITSSISIIIIGYCINEFLKENENISDRNNFLTSNIFIVGSYDLASFTNILIHGLALSIHRFAKKCHGNQRLQMRLFGVILMIQMISSVGTVTLYFAHKTYHEHLVQNIANDAIHLIGQYDGNPSVRRSLDVLQTRYHCCGFKDFVDWLIYRRVQPMESQHLLNKEINDISDLSLTSHHSLPDSCCDPNSYNNLCLLSSNVEKNSSDGYRVGCAGKMEEDVGLWLKFGLINILICLLFETSLIPLMIVYCQLFSGFILVSVEIPRSNNYRKYERHQSNNDDHNNDDDANMDPI